MTTKNLVSAIRDSLHDEMAADDRVILLGEDVARRGGVFKISEGFLDEFGDQRVLDTPLAEERSPVPLPKRNDFPVIVYLTAAEVRREAERLVGMDLSFPEDEGIEAERKALLRALRKAARKRVGVVGFYY